MQFCDPHAFGTRRWASCPLHPENVRGLLVLPFLTIPLDRVDFDLDESYDAPVDQIDTLLNPKDQP